MFDIERWREKKKKEESVSLARIGAHLAVPTSLNLGELSHTRRRAEVELTPERSAPVIDAFPRVLSAESGKFPTLVAALL